MDPPVDFEPISRTKIIPPPVRPETLHRERLLDWLDRHTRRRLTFVVANAGYGKTTLLADFTERAPRRCIWFRLDHTDGDWVTFLNYMTAAIETVAPEFGRATYSLFAQVAVAKPSLEAAIGAFMVDVGSLPDEALLLVLDATTSSTKHLTFAPSSDSSCATVPRRCTSSSRPAASLSSRSRACKPTARLQRSTRPICGSRETSSRPCSRTASGSRSSRTSWT